MPPWIWPSTINGFSSVPASSTAMIRRTTTLPVSVSTSTTATCAPNGNVGCAALKSLTPTNGSPSEPATSAQPTAGTGEPATWKVPATTSSTTSSTAASRRLAARWRPASASLPAATINDDPATTTDREPPDSPPVGTSAVSPGAATTEPTDTPSGTPG